MRYETLVNTQNITMLVNTAQQILGPSPRRKGFIISPVAAGATGQISIGMRPDVAVGAGALNYLLGATYPTIVDDDAVGSAISNPWYAISLNGGEVLQVLEILYDNEVPGTPGF